MKLWIVYIPLPNATLNINSERFDWNQYSLTSQRAWWMREESPLPFASDSKSGKRIRLSPHTIPSFHLSHVPQSSRHSIQLFGVFIIPNKLFHGFIPDIRDIYCKISKINTYRAFRIIYYIRLSTFPSILLGHFYSSFIKFSVSTILSIKFTFNILFRASSMSLWVLT